MQKPVALLAALALLAGAIAVAPAAPPKPKPSKPAKPAKPTKSAGKYITTKSGLKYLDVVVGKGKSPQPTSSVSVMYKGTFPDGKVFDQSKAPISFPLNRVIKGWQEGLLTMKEGGKRKLILPGNLGYGPEGMGTDIPPNATLLFDVELLKVE